ncbi:MAG: toll/interleukin-1 receptor domain-containing protein [Candidatus Xenobiia bacterium LiM19]
MMILLEKLVIEHRSQKHEISLWYGDLTKIPEAEKVDLLVVSAFPNDYTPTDGSLIGALQGIGVSVDALSKKKAADLRQAFSCWLSDPISNKAAGFKRILCFEPLIKASEPSEVIGDMFQGIIPFALSEPQISTIAMPLLTTGDMGFSPDEMLKPLLDAASHWMSKGLPVLHLKIVERDEQKAQKLAELFREAKVECAQLQSRSPKRFAYDLFFSYSQTHLETALFMKKEFEKMRPGIKIFIDKLEVEIGSSWPEKIFKNIDYCEKVVPFFSPEYLKSRACIFEYNTSLTRLLRPSPLSDSNLLSPIYLYTADLPSYMTVHLYYDCREGDYQKISQACVKILEELDKRRQSSH